MLKRSGKDKKADRYFSIISDERSLDFEASSAANASLIATRLTLLIIDLKRDSKWWNVNFCDVNGICLIILTYKLLVEWMERHYEGDDE